MAKIKTKKLNAKTVRELKEINDYRKSQGLRVYEIKTRNCLSCGMPFETWGPTYSCGCAKKVTDYEEAGRYFTSYPH